MVAQACRWIDGPEGEVSASADPLVLRTESPLYTANLRANERMVRDLVHACHPRPKTLVLDQSRQSKVTTTI